MPTWAVYNQEGVRILSTENIIKARGFASVRNLKVESDKGITKTPIAPITTTTTPNPVQEYQKVTTSDILHQQAKDQKVLDQLGIKRTKAIFAEGSKLISGGVHRMGESKREFENLPDFEEGIKSILSQIKEEKREPSLFSKLSDVRMDADGLVYFGGIKEGFVLEDPVKFLSTTGIFPKFGELFKHHHRTPHLADFFNSVIRFNTEIDEEITSKQIQFGVREGTHSAKHRSIYRAVTGSYTPIEADFTLNQFSDICIGTKGAKLLGGYNRLSTRFDLTCLFHANHNTIGAGSVFKFGAKLTGNDRGGQSVKLDAIAWRNLCLNLLIIAQETSNFARLIHRGDKAIQEGKYQDAIIAMKPHFDAFIDDWGYLTKTPILGTKIWGKTFADVEKALEWGVKHKKISTGTKDKALLENLLSGYMYEKGNSIESLINAITRTAHVAYKGERREALEKRSGELVRELVKVRVR